MVGRLLTAGQPATLSRHKAHRLSRNTTAPQPKSASSTRSALHPTSGQTNPAHSPHARLPRPGVKCQRVPDPVRYMHDMHAHRTRQTCEEKLRCTAAPAHGCAPAPARHHKPRPPDSRFHAVPGTCTVLPTTLWTLQTHPHRPSLVSLAPTTLPAPPSQHASRPRQCSDYLAPTAAVRGGRPAEKPRLQCRHVRRAGAATSAGPARRWRGRRWCGCQRA